MSSYQARILSVTGQSAPINPLNGSWFTLEELQHIVNGHIEIVPLANNEMMVCNEEGKLLGLPLNYQATVLFNAGGRMWFDPIAGDVLICAALQLTPDEEPLSDDDDELPF